MFGNAQPPSDNNVCDLSARGPSASGLVLPGFRFVDSAELDLCKALGGPAPMGGFPEDRPDQVRKGAGRPFLDHSKIRMAEQSKARQQKRQSNLKATQTTHREQMLRKLLFRNSPVAKYPGLIRITPGNIYRVTGKFTP